MTAESDKAKNSRASSTGTDKVTRLGRYRLVRKLGQGGMGTVYEAIQDGLERRVALKVLPKSLVRDPDYVERFRREAKAAAALNHVNIVHIYEIAEDRGYLFYSMELVDGQSLENRLKQFGCLSPQDAIELILQAVRGLAHAWKQDIVHRDIKPANLMVTGDGTLKIADFGLAKAASSAAMTRTGAGMGTPYYMSPEQGYNAKNVDFRSDIFSLGATFFHLVTGRVPFEGDSPIEVGIKIATAPLPPVRSVNPVVPAGIVAVIERMLAKNPDERYQNSEQLLAELEGAARQDFEKSHPRRCPVCGHSLELGSPVLHLPGNEVSCQNCKTLLHIAANGRLSAFHQENAPIQQSAFPRPPHVKAEVVQAELVRADPQHPCPACGKALLLVPHTAGKDVQCPLCNSLLSVSADRKMVVVSPPSSVQRDGANVLTNSIGMTLVSIPAGDFLMGAGPDETEALPHEAPQHWVRITKPFYLGIYPVTQEQYAWVMQEQVRGDPRVPIEEASWFGAKEFCRRLSEQDGRTYRLPTEAQWEYACRAGAAGRWCFGDDEWSLGEYAWYSCDGVQPVGKKEPNNWSLHDMHGNVWEWCADWYTNYDSNPQVDPTGPARGMLRILRGGCWFSGATGCRSAFRSWSTPGAMSCGHGFRVASISETT